MSEPIRAGFDDRSRSAAIRHRRIMIVFTLAMMAMSWPIWVPDSSIPRFPVQGLQAFVDANPALDSAAFAICLAGLTLGLFRGRAGRFGSALAATSGLVLIAFDQNRLQAWFYQTIILSSVYALLPAPSAVGFVRFFAVTLYFHSALSKLDWSFAHSMGPYLLSPFLNRLPFALDAGMRSAIALSLPAGEMAFALALACGFCRIGLAGASFMHLGLMALLGPWALDHSGNVLLWNVSMLIQAWFLFRSPLGHDSDAIVSNRDHADDSPRPASTAPPAALGIVQLGMLAVALLPFFERAGLWDPWPSFALYAGHVEQLRIDWPAELKAEIPAEFAPFLKTDRDDLVLDLTLWSRARCGVPPYPASRIHRRLAAWIASRCPKGIPMRVTLLSKANWRTGVREETTLSSLQAIRNP